MGLMYGTGPLGREPAGTFNFEPPAPGRALYLEPTPKRIRVVVAGETVADSSRAMLLHESGHQPVYYFPPQDVRSELLEPSDRHTVCPKKGEASYYTIRVGEHVVDAGAWYYPEPIEEAPPIKDLIAFYWQRMDHWLEEDEEVFGHPRDPYHRVDMIPTSRHIRISLDGELLAESHEAIALFESNLPPRWYLRREDVVAARAHRDDHALPIQGNRHLPLGQAGRRSRRQRFDLDVRRPDCRGPPDPRPAVLLQRTGRRRTRRRAPGSAGVRVEPRREERSPERSGGPDARLAGSGPPPPRRLSSRRRASRIARRRAASWRGVLVIRSDVTRTVP